jgi:hypothetical protein
MWSSTWRWEQYISPKHRCTLYGAKPRKTTWFLKSLNDKLWFLKIEAICLPETLLHTYRTIHNSMQTCCSRSVHIAILERLRSGVTCSCLYICAETVDAEVAHYSSRGTVPYCITFLRLGLNSCVAINEGEVLPWQRSTWQRPTSLSVLHNTSLIESPAFASSILPRNLRIMNGPSMYAALFYHTLSNPG